MPSAMLPERERLLYDREGHPYDQAAIRQRVVQTAKEYWPNRDDGDTAKASATETDMAEKLREFSIYASGLTGPYDLGVSELPSGPRLFTDEDRIAQIAARLISIGGVCPTRTIARQWLGEDNPTTRLFSGRLDLIDHEADGAAGRGTETSEGGTGVNVSKGTHDGGRRESQRQRTMMTDG